MHDTRPLPTTCEVCGCPDTDDAYLGLGICGHVVCIRCYDQRCPLCPDPLGEEDTP